MKRWLGAVAILAFLATGAAPAQTKPSEPAAAEARTGKSGGTLHVESTTKNAGPGPNTKVKSESVIGTVKRYAAGKKITVTGPKQKDYTFDLDENVAMKGSVNVGDRVKVSYSKADGGQKVTTVVPYPTATRSRRMKKAAA